LNGHHLRSFALGAIASSQERSLVIISRVRWLSVADVDFVPYLALIAFGGVRSAELRKGLLWESINFERGDIIVPAAIAKTGRKRKIVMSENLIEWLAPYRLRTGAIFAKKPQRRIDKIVTLSGVKWKRNALRHSFGSYRMEQTKNEGQVALEMGNSPKIVHDHYFEIVDASAAEAYWSIKPLSQTDRKIVGSKLRRTDVDTQTRSSARL
jgi:integrase